MQNKLRNNILLGLGILALLFSIGSIILGLLFKIESWEGANEILVRGALMLLPTGVLFYKASNSASPWDFLKQGIAIICIVVGLFVFALGIMVHAEYYVLFSYEIALVGSCLFILGIILLPKKKQLIR
jgi:hypothetical protein